jgi:predicted RNase H-like nuclease (RuvC/YqgF family)
MDDFCKSSNYRSTWRPLMKEEDSGIVNSPPNVEKVKKECESIEKTVEKNETCEESDILKKLTQMSSDINTLNDMLSEQKQTMDRLFTLLEEKETITPKKVLNLQKNNSDQHYFISVLFAKLRRLFGRFLIFSQHILHIKF